MASMETFLGSLERHGCCPRRNGNGWAARCPAHDDVRASLSVAAGDNGGVVLHCHAGCTTESVVSKLGLRMSDLMPERPPKANGQPVAAPANGRVFQDVQAAQRALELTLGPVVAYWDYHNAQGAPVGRVLRWSNDSGGKEIRPLAKHLDGWRIGAMPSPRPLYALPEILRAPPTTPIVVCEGEKAADVARQCNLVATTSAGGANAADKTDWAPLRGRRVLILPDNDEAGVMYAADVARLAGQAGAAEIKILRLADYAAALPPGGDLADVVADDRWCGLPLGDAAQRADLGAWVLATAKHIETTKPEWIGWPEIDPFDVVDVPQFPTHTLPDVLREWVEAESHATQTPADLAGLLSLAVCSAVIARRVEISPRDRWREPTNLFVTVLLEPGNRKSAVFADALQPLREMEDESIEDAQPSIARAVSERRQTEARLRRLEKLAAEKGDEDCRREAVNLAVELDLQTVPTPPRLIVDDATAEKLGMMLAEQGGRIASMSPEGGVFDLMAGLYSKSGMPQFGVYLMGHSGDDLIVDRVGRKSVRVKRPALTCAYTIQPEVIRGLAAHTAFRGRGLLARFLYAAPQSRIGHRLIAPTPVPDTTWEAYRQAVRTLGGRVSNESEGVVLRLDGEAEALFRAWEAEIESMLADEGVMEAMRDWGAKLAGATLRLAAVIHCVEHGLGELVGPPTMASAIEIARYAIPHAAAVLGLMLDGKGAAHSNARCVLRWIERHERREFTRREAHLGCKHRFPTVDDLDVALAELERRHYIRRSKVEVAKPGRPPSPAYEVNPVIVHRGP